MGDSKIFMMSVILGIYVGLCINYYKKYKKEQEKRKEQEWELYECYREKYGYDTNREKMQKHKSRAPRKKHLLR